MLRAGLIDTICLSLLTLPSDAPEPPHIGSSHIDDLASLEDVFAKTSSGASSNGLWEFSFYEKKKKIIVETCRRSIVRKS